MISRRLVTGLAAFALLTSAALAGESEQDILNRYINKVEKKHVQKLSWVSANFSLDRINRNNDYNDFVNTQNNFFDGEFQWLNTAPSIGAEFGIMAHKRFAVTVGGEYWFKIGDELKGNFSYEPTGATVTDPSSKIQVFGFTAGVQYYVYNPPTPADMLIHPSLRLVGNVGYYSAKWELFSEYRSLNLATALPETNNLEFQGSAPGFSFGLGGDYPLSKFGLAIGADISYLYLNFDNVAWYNSYDQEVVATFAGTPDSRVNLELSGVRGKIELKKFFSW